MRATKIVIIGAASTSFGPDMIADAVLTPEIRGSTVVLVDIDAERLAVMGAYARRLNTLLDAGIAFEQTTDRTRALPGAEFVLTAVAVRRAELWNRWHHHLESAGAFLEQADRLSEHVAHAGNLARPASRQHQ